MPTVLFTDVDPDWISTPQLTTVGAKRPTQANHARLQLPRMDGDSRAAGGKAMNTTQVGGAGEGKQGQGGDRLVCLTRHDVRMRHTATLLKEVLGTR